MPEIHLIGELSCSLHFSLPTFCSWCVYTPTASTNWRLLSGSVSGRTWLAEPQSVVPYRAVWNSPIDVHYIATDIHGYPMLHVTVYSVDRYDRVDLAGYACCRLPTQSGHHQRRLMCHRPKPTTISQQLINQFLGGSPRYAEATVILSGDSRYGHESISTGMVELSLTVVHCAFPDFVHLDPMKKQLQIEEDSMCFRCRTTTELTASEEKQVEQSEEERIRLKAKQLIEEAEQQEAQQQSQSPLQQVLESHSITQQNEVEKKSSQEMTK